MQDKSDDIETSDPMGGAANPAVQASMPGDEAAEPVLSEPVERPEPPAEPVEEPVAEAEQPEDEKKPVGEGESLLELVKTVVYALLIAVAIRTFLFQPFNIPSGSMENTLLIGDYLFVEKFAYGYSHFSFPWGGWPVGGYFHGRVLASEPTPGDVIVFKMPNPNSADYLNDFIKRLIGMPGDRIQMLGGVLYINDKAVPKVRVEDYIGPDRNGIVRNIARYRETLPNGRSYYVLDSEENSSEDNTQVFVVPPGHYFMMGDNRDNSDDSRMEVGYVPAENLVGKAVIRFFSIDDSAVWYEPWTWPGAIRYSRMFTIVH
jgi:signal peptidase I